VAFKFVIWLTFENDRPQNIMIPRHNMKHAPQMAIVYKRQNFNTTCTPRHDKENNIS